MKFGNNTLETDNYEDIELQETTHKCTYCDEPIKEDYENEMTASFDDEKFCNRFCEEQFHKNA